MLEWCVNFQESVRRYTYGLETRDLTLDLRIAPDLRAHRWIEIDEFEERIAADIYEPSELERLTDQDSPGRQWAIRTIAGTLLKVREGWMLFLTHVPPAGRIRAGIRWRLAGHDQHLGQRRVDRRHTQGR